MNQAYNYFMTEWGRVRPENARREMMRRYEWWRSKNNKLLSDMYAEWIDHYDKANKDL